MPMLGPYSGTAEQHKITALPLVQLQPSAKSHVHALARVESVTWFMHEHTHTHTPLTSLQLCGRALCKAKTSIYAEREDWNYLSASEL